jgi:8-oxo-dGTP pyrophosphatase MutT (NUDIX family)
MPRPEPKPWVTLSSRIAFDGRWLKLRADECRTAEGRLVSPYYVIEAADFIHVAALTEDRRLVMVRQYRQGTGRSHLELPAGMIDAGDAGPLLAAQRELREETGYEAEGWREAAVWFANPARQSNRHHLFLAQGARLAGPAALDGDESLVVELVPLDEVEARIASGAIDSSLHVAAVLRALLAWR